MKLPSVIFCSVLISVVMGCEKPAEKAAPATEKEQKAPSQKDEQKVGSKIGKIVFLDQKECCNCTRERQARTWDALQAVIEKMEPKPAVETVHRDTQPEDAQMFLDLEPTMVSPGLYFFGVDGLLVDTLQGELTEAQILKLME